MLSKENESVVFASYIFATLLIISLLMISSRLGSIAQSLKIMASPPAEKNNVVP
jgi:hypothetical protein